MKSIMIAATVMLIDIALLPTDVQAQGCFRCCTGSCSPTNPACTTSGGEGGPTGSLCWTDSFGACHLSGRCGNDQVTEVSDAEVATSSELNKYVDVGVSLRRTGAGSLFLAVNDRVKFKVSIAPDGTLMVEDCDGVYSVESFLSALRASTAVQTYARALFAKAYAQAGS